VLAMMYEMLLSFDALIEALQEQGLEETYNNLYNLFNDFKVVIIDWEKGVIGEFEHPCDFYDYLELLNEKLEKGV
jgi:hypothetical protein